MNTDDARYEAAWRAHMRAEDGGANRGNAIRDALAAADAIDPVRARLVSAERDLDDEKVHTQALRVQLADALNLNGWQKLARDANRAALAALARAEAAEALKEQLKTALDKANRDLSAYQLAEHTHGCVDCGRRVDQVMEAQMVAQHFRGVLDRVRELAEDPTKWRWCFGRQVILRSDLVAAVQVGATSGVNPGGRDTTQTRQHVNPPNGDRGLINGLCGCVMWPSGLHCTIVGNHVGPHAHHAGIERI